MTDEALMQKIEDILGRMSVADKVALCSGADYWHTKTFEQYGIPSITLTDGPHGLRQEIRSGACAPDAGASGTGPASPPSGAASSDRSAESRPAAAVDSQDAEKPSSSDVKRNHASSAAGRPDPMSSTPATCFPPAVTAAQTWNRRLIYEEGRAIGEEAKEAGLGVVLGPGVNIKRNPLCGRNFEYYSEDPYVAGEMGAAFVSGVQTETGIGTSLKHFACNSQEYCRLQSDSQMDERTLREIYLRAFEKVVKKSQPATVMCAYNRVNGTYCSDNRRLLSDILRGEWGFQGAVVTDWGALNDRTAAFRAGCDLVMPGGSAYGEKEALAALEAGELSEEDVTACARRVLTLVLRRSDALEKGKDYSYDRTSHRTTARRIAEEGAVLLKNNDHALPIPDMEGIVLVGAMAADMRYQGGGSSHVNAERLMQVRECLPDASYVEGCDDRGNVTEDSLIAVTRAAARAKKVIVFVGLPEDAESEGYDRKDLELPVGHNRMVRAALAGNPQTIVVLMSGSPVKLPWFEDVAAVLYVGLCGQEGGQAIAGLLTGKVNPSGRLAETWPLEETDIPSYGFYGNSAGSLRRVAGAATGAGADAATGTGAGATASSDAATGTGAGADAARSADAATGTGAGADAAMSADAATGTGAGAARSTGTATDAGAAAKDSDRTTSGPGPAAANSRRVNAGPGPADYRDAQYREGIYVGYRYYDKAGRRVRFPFGYGLSYTEFAYTGLKVSEQQVSVRVRNVGMISGSEVVQLYVGNPQDGIFRPVKELRAFEKVHLKPLEETTVLFHLAGRDFAVYQDGWKIPTGTYVIMVGSSSADIRLSQTVEVTGEELTVPVEFRAVPEAVANAADSSGAGAASSPQPVAYLPGSWYVHPTGQPSLSEWRALMGGTLPASTGRVPGAFDLNSSVMDMAPYSRASRMVIRFIERYCRKNFGDEDSPQYRMSLLTSAGGPLRSLKMFAPSLPEWVLTLLLFLGNHGHAKH